MYKTNEINFSKKKLKLNNNNNNNNNNKRLCLLTYVRNPLSKRVLKFLHFLHFLPSLSIKQTQQQTQYKINHITMKKIFIYKKNKK